MKKKSNSRGDNRGRFVSDTDHLLENFRGALAKVKVQRNENSRQLAAQRSAWNADIKKTVATLVPDISPRTISLLKRDVPSFVTKCAAQQVEEARNVRVPLLTRWFGDAEAFKRRKLDRTISLLQAQLQSWIEQQRPSTLLATRNLGATISKIDSLTQEGEKLAATEAELQAQIAQLMRARDLPAPTKELTDAVGKSADRLRDNRSRWGSDTSSRDDFDVVRDVYIPMVIYDTLFHSTSTEGRYHDNDYRGGGGTSGGGGSTGSYSSSREDHGGGMEIHAGRDGGGDHGGGVEVSMPSEQSSDSDHGGGISSDTDRGALS